MRYCLALDLKNDAAQIAAYEEYHRHVWPEIIKSIKEAGIDSMEIYRVSNRLFMIVEGSESFSLEKKASMDLKNPKVLEWENLMWKYQQAIPGSNPGEKWRILSKIFDLKDF